MQFASQPDVVIVGAGPAGSAAAIEIARAGRAVMLCDRAVFPRRKVCGGCLSGDATELLGTLLGDGVAALGTIATQITFTIGRRSFRALGGEKCRIVPRDVLDTRLAGAAEAAGCTLQFGVRAELVHESTARFAVRTDEQHLQPRWIVWAAGLHGLPMLQAFKPTLCKRALIGQAWSAVPDEAHPPVGSIAMHWLRGGYLGLATACPEQCLVALAVENRLSGGGRPWEALRAANPESAILRRIHQPPSPQMQGAAGFPHRPRRIGCGNLLLAGDAVGFEEPFTGEGIGQAVQSGIAAAKAILAVGDDDSVVHLYGRALRHHRRVRRRTRWLSAVLRSRLVHALTESALSVPVALGESILKAVHVQPVAQRT